MRAPALIERASLQDLDFDSLNHIFSKQNLFLIRSLSKGIKDRVDNTPLAAIKLSAEGTKQATASFFSSFQGLLMIESQHGWSASAGWFRSYLDTGLNPNHELSLDIDDSNIHVLLENFTKSYLTLGKSTKMRRLHLFFRSNCRDLENSYTSLAGLHQFATRIVLRLDIGLRPPLALQTIIRHLANLPDSVSIVDLTIRYDYFTARQQDGTASFVSILWSACRKSPRTCSCRHTRAHAPPGHPAHAVSSADPPLHSAQDCIPRDPVSSIYHSDCSAEFSSFNGFSHR